MKRYNAGLAALAILLGSSIAVPALAAEDDPEKVTFSNSYVQVDIGTKGSVEWTNIDGTKTKVPVTGRWLVSTVSGDPETDADDNQWLNYNVYYNNTLWPAHWFGYWKVKVGDQIRVIGDTGTGHWSIKPYLHDPPAAGYGFNGGFIVGEWETSDNLCRIGMRIFLIRDQVRFEMTLINSGTITQNIGLEMVGDSSIADSEKVFYPYIPGLGYTKSSEYSSVPREMLFTTKNMPSSIDVYDSIEAPNVVARNTLTGQDCTTPDYVALGNYNQVAMSTMWIPTGFTPNPIANLEDLAWVVNWNQRAIAPGASRKIITYYGVGAATELWTYPSGSTIKQDKIVAAVQGPKSLVYNSVNAAALNDIEPSPFSVKAYLYNIAKDPGAYDLHNATAFIDIPPGQGLQLASGETAMKTIGPVPKGSEANPVEWLVEATGEVTGNLEYTVIFSDIKRKWTQSVACSITVPATRSTLLGYGYQFIHVPFDFNDSSISNAFGLNPGSFRALWYDPSVRDYVPLTQLQSGKSFWMRDYGVTGIGANKLISLNRANAKIVGEMSRNQLVEQHIRLQPGWNMIGNPFLYPVYLGQLTVAENESSTSMTMEQAAAKQLIKKTMYAWNPKKYGYDYVSSNTTLLQPWLGYWIYAKKSVILTFLPAVYPGSDIITAAGGF